MLSIRTDHCSCSSRWTPKTFQDLTLSKDSPDILTSNVLALFKSKMSDIRFVENSLLLVFNKLWSLDQLNRSFIFFSTITEVFAMSGVLQCKYDVVDKLCQIHRLEGRWHIGFLYFDPLYKTTYHQFKVGYADGLRRYRI